MADIKEKIEMPYRRCIVNGEKALFHKWIEQDKMVIRANIRLKEKDANGYMEMYEKTKVLPEVFRAITITNNYAIIEDLKGNVKLVEPESVKFEDSAEDLILDTEVAQMPLGGFEKFSRFFCPKCIEGVKVYEPKCPKCGQKIDWSGV